MARLKSPKRTKNVNELQVAVMYWELTLVEHESKFSEMVADSEETAAMRTIFPKDILERFLDGPFHNEELRNRVSACVGEKLAGQDANGGPQPMDIGQIDKSEGEEDVSAVQQRRPADRANHKHKLGLPTCHHQHHANRPHETRNRGAMRRNRSRARKSVSFATSVVERAILPDPAQQQMIART